MFCVSRIKGKAVTVNVYSRYIKKKKNPIIMLSIEEGSKVQMPKKYNIYLKFPTSIKEKVDAKVPFLIHSFSLL